MNCPACTAKPKLQLTRIENDFVIRKCEECEGFWVPSFQYWKWQKTQPKNLPEKDAQIKHQDNDSKAGKFCPECSTYLANRPVGHGLDFSIDHCFNCKGYWLDKGEWDSLNEKNLHDEIHLIFTHQWQNELKQIESDENYEKMVRTAIGDEAFERTSSFKSWLSSQENPGVILNFINESK